MTDPNQPNLLPLQIATQRLNALFQASPDAVFLHRDDFSIADVNERALQLFGYSHEEFLQRSVLDISGEGFTEARLAQLRAESEACQLLEFEWLAQRSNGEEFPVEVRLLRLRSDLEDEVTMVAIVRDLSARKAAEAEALATQERMRLHLENTPLGIIEWDREQRVVAWNPAAERIFGYRHDEALGRTATELIIPEDLGGKIHGLWKDLLESRGGYRSTNHNRTRDGRRILCDWYNTCLRNEHGEAFAVATVVDDITERTRLHEELTQSRTEWAYAMDFFEDAIYLVDLDDRVVRANRAFCELTGLTPEQLVGRDIMDIMHPHGERTPCPVCAARKARRDTRITMEADDPANPVSFPVDIMLRVTRNEQGEPIGILMGIRNLSEQRRIEAELRQHRDHLEELVQERTQQLEASNQELESFSYSVSHDLRAPLRSIAGFSQLVQEEYGERLDDTARNYLTRVCTNAQRMGLLIDDMLRLSRMTRHAMRYEAVDLSSIATQVIGELRETEPQRNVEFQCTPDLRVQGDAKLLQTVLVNLLGNAWKYTQFRPRAVIHFGSTQREGASCYFVRDNGAGFDMQYSHKLFEAFQRLHRMEEFPGNGIGLATVQRIILRHGGETWAEGQPDQGATFYFSLPKRTPHIPEPKA